MSKYKVGDKFIIEIDDVMLGSTAENNPTALYRIKGFNSLVFDKNGLDKLEKIPTSDAKDWSENIEAMEREYNRGLNDAWELARKICGNSNRNNNYTGLELESIFGNSFTKRIIDNYTYQQTLAKIEAYEKSQQIQVGDVVKVRTGAGSEHLGVVTQITANQNCACIVYADGSTEMNTANNMTKTNKHLDIEHLLEQIRGDE